MTPVPSREAVDARLNEIRERVKIRSAPWENPVVADVRWLLDLVEQLQAERAANPWRLRSFAEGEFNPFALEDNCDADD